MSNATLKFGNHLNASDPQKTPVLIVGQKQYLSSLPYSKIKSKLVPRVSEEVYKLAIENLKPSAYDTRSLYLNQATIACLPKVCSRHNTPSQAHSLTKLIKSCVTGNNEYIVIVCEYRDCFASACAIARAFPVYSRKTKTHASHTVTVEFIIVSSEGDFTALEESDIECLTIAAEGVRLAAKLVDMPCNELNTDDFLEEITKIGETLSIKPEIIRGEELRKRGFGGLYAVGQGAVHPPALAVLSHKPEGAKHSIAWVGKGIVYDTGGLSIKSKNSMVGMKRDCGGAAAILGAFYVAVKLGFQANLHAVFCLAENSVGPKSIRPDDIITMYSGKTVEINNTDAEGRLVVGDGVAYADRDLKAAVIVDMATLTGAQGTATGRYHAVLLSNYEEWEKAVVKAGRTSGDLVHPMPYCPEIHFSEFTSTFADMKNSVADRSNAQPSCAGLFINAQMGFDTERVWIHIDMASPGHSGERATGYGVALLATLFGQATKSHLLEELAPKFSLHALAEHAAKKIRLE